MFKKVLAVGFSAVLALSLVACGGSKDNKSKSSKETTLHCWEVLPLSVSLI